MIAHVQFKEEDFDLSSFPAADQESVAGITKYWSGEEAPEFRHASADLFWTGNFFYIRFLANQSEPLNVSENPNVEEKTLGLWDRDVCEVFVAPDAAVAGRYFEFEVAPTGEWIDLAIDSTGGSRETDWEYSSGMECAAALREGTVEMAMRIPWSAFGSLPAPGDSWKGNLFRIVGSGQSRGYLAWSPTNTETPNFHVPSAFGDIVFG